jgi:hypothetical protein
MNSETACAFSEGAPGLNLDEHSGDNSTLGTTRYKFNMFASNLLYMALT